MLIRSNLKILLLIVLNLIIILFFIYIAINNENTLFKSVKNPICKDCNVILISLDTLSANHLPCYGYGRNTSPRLCQFAKDNIIFTNTYANATFTLPSHVTMFTGLIPSRHKVKITNVDQLDKNTPFLPEILKQNGYITNFYMPTTDIHLPINKVYNRGIDKIIQTNNETNNNLRLWKEGLQELIQNNKKGKKTFMFLHTYYVHLPYLIGDKKPIYTDKTYDNIPIKFQQISYCSSKYIDYFVKALKNDLDNNYWGDKTNAYQGYFNQIRLNKGNKNKICKIINLKDNLVYKSRYYTYTIDKNDPGQIEYIKSLYDQKINELDQLLLDIFKIIQSSDLKKNTVVIITADHGEEFMEHGYTEHTTLYDSNLKIPLIMYVPGLHSKKIDQLAQTADIMPTILDFVGIKNNYNLQGFSLKNAIFKNYDDQKLIVSEKEDAKEKVIRNKQYKLFVVRKKGNLIPIELYNIQNDINESKNILFSNPDIVTLLLNQLKKY